VTIGTSDNQQRSALAAPQPAAGSGARDAPAAATALRTLPQHVRIAALVGDGRSPMSFAPRVAVLGEPVRVTLHEAACNTTGAIDRAMNEAAARSSCGLVIVRADYELGSVFEPTAMRPADPQAPALTLLPIVEDVALPDTQGRPALSKPAFVGGWSSSLGEAGYRAAVARAVEYIHAGDIFQTNLAHALRAPFNGPPRDAFAAIAETLRPAFGVYIEDGPRSVLSVSPELFLDVRTDRRVVTRPIKGTRPAGETHHGGLLADPKDLAELNMIIDLMRNDLGRVAMPASVRVDEARRIESHHTAKPERAGDRDGDATGVTHAVATVSAELRSGATLADLLAACFPPGSVTGAPKVRAMQIIDELERNQAFPARGPYCGALGIVDARAHTATLNVAIRTMTIDREARTVTLPVGAGIVADSDPLAEWRETLIKAAPIVAALGGGASGGPGDAPADLTPDGAETVGPDA
jgi:anthranilate/para-aminobenzoate synthase component I